MSFLLRVAILLGLGFAGFVLYGMALDYLGGVIVTKDRSLVHGALLVQGFLAAALVSTALCFPLAKLFGRHSPYAAFAIGLPALWLRVPELMDPSRHVLARVMSGYDVFAYACLLVVGTNLMHRKLSVRSASPRVAASGARP